MSVLKPLVYSTVVCTISAICLQSIIHFIHLISWKGCLLIVVELCLFTLDCILNIRSVELRSADGAMEMEMKLF